MTHSLEITRCPTCGSKEIRRVRRDVRRRARGRSYVVRDLEFHECPECGEHVYDREAMRRIEAASPAYDRVGSC